MPCLLYNLGGVLMNLLTAVLCLLLSRIGLRLAGSLSHHDVRGRGMVSR